MPLYPCGGPSDRSAGGCGASLTERERSRRHQRGFCFDCHPPYDEDRACPECGKRMGVRDWMDQRVCNDCEERD